MVRTFNATSNGDNGNGTGHRNGTPRPAVLTALEQAQQVQADEPMLVSAAPVPAEAAAPVEWEPILPLSATEAVEPFPVDVLPPMLQRFVLETAAAKHCPPDYIGVPLLVLAGSAIGNARCIQIKPDWPELPNLYAVVIAPIGSAKSPALAAVKEPFKRRQGKLIRDHKKEHPADLPLKERLYVSDTTTEKLAELLGDNKAIARIEDELSAFFCGFNQYRAGGKGNDRQFYLSLHAGTGVSVDRLRLGVPLDVHYPCFSLVGNLVPNSLHLLRAEGPQSDGMVERCLTSYPTPLPHVREDFQSASKVVRAVWADTLKGLWALQPIICSEEGYRPHPIKLAAAGREVWADFTQEIADDLNRPTFPDHLRGTWSKSRGHCARLALILHYLWHGTVNDSLRRVDAEAVSRAVVCMHYFMSHARRVHASLGADGTSDRAARILEWITRGKRREFKTWELHRDLASDQRFRSVDAYAEPLDRLRKHSFIRPKQAPARQGGGRPAGPTFEVNPELYRAQDEGQAPEVALVRDFYRLWTGRSGVEPTDREVGQARRILADYGEVKASALIPIAVRRMKQEFPQARSFAAVLKFLPDASEIYDREEGTGEMSTARAARQTKESAEDARRRKAKEAAETREQRLVLEGLWNAASQRERDEVETMIRGLHPHLRPGGFAFKTACLAALQSRKMGSPTTENHRVN